MAGILTVRVSGAAIGVLLACLATPPALAESVPLPQPRPLTMTVPTTTGAVAVPAAALRARAQQGGLPNPVSNPFAGLLGRPPGSQALSAEQRAIVERVNAYLSKTQILSGQFVQVGPDGARTQGEFYISKPGRVRFEYDDPSPIELIADGTSVVVRDRRLATQDVYPLSQTPLRFLLADHIDLLRDTDVVGVYADDIFVTVVIEERQILGGTHRVMLMFGAKDYQLRQWTVTDPQGYDTTVAVYNLDAKAAPDPNMFRIDYTRQIQ